MTSVWLALLGCPGEPVDTDGEPVELQPLDATSLEDVTRAFTDLGARMVATPAEAEGVALAVELLEDAGLTDVHTEPFTWDAWVRGPADIELGGELLPALALSPSPPTERTAPLVLDGQIAEGAFVIVTDQGTSRGAQAVGAATQGARGMIRVTERDTADGHGLIEVGHTLQGLSLPCVAVDRATGQRLREATGQTATLRIDSEERIDHVSHNVVGDVLGTGRGMVYVVAHVDSWDTSESAADNAIGVGALVLLARRLADGPPPVPTVRFIVTTAEEQGLQGALAYARAHPDEVGDADLVLNLDVLWSQEGVFVVMAEPEVMDRAIQLAADEGIEAIDGGLPNPSSDNFPFQIAGSPAFWSGRFGFREYHTHADVAGELDWEQAAGALRVQWGILEDAVR